MNPASPLAAPPSSEPTWEAFDALVRSRRAVHTFSSRPVAQADMEAILGAALLAPSSFNLQPYELYWVRSPEHRQQMATLCLGQKAARTAQEFVVCVARWDQWRECGEEHLAFLRASPHATEKQVHHHAGIYRQMRLFFAEGPLNVLGWVRTLAFALRGLWRPTMRPPAHPGEHATWAVKSTSLVCENLMLAARARGLDTCPLEGFDAVRVARLLGLDGHRWSIPMVIALGYREASERFDPQWRRAPEKLIKVV
jgi:nitroreductase